MTRVICQSWFARLTRPTWQSALAIVPAARSKAGAAASGSIRFQIGLADLTITVPSSANHRILRYSASLGGILTLEENAVEALRMDLLTLDSNANRPLVRPGGDDYIIGKAGSFVITGNGIDTGSRLMHNEAFA